MPWDEIGATFSDIWYRVADARPRLTPHAQVVRQWYGPTISYIIEDPASGQYYRLSESAYFFIGLLDGKRTVDDAWNASNQQLGDGAPTQRECIQMLSQLQLFGLLLSDNELAADMVLERKLQARQTKIKQRTGMWVFWNIPLYNPEPFLERHKRIMSLIFSRFGAAIWLAVVLTAVYLLLRNLDRFGTDFFRYVALDPRGLVMMSVIFLALRAIHEMAHAAACKAMGGRSTEIGVIMIAGVLPLPYCDATSAWRLPETWKRVLVSAAGVLVESFLAALAGIYWVLGDEASAPMMVGLAYQVLLISSVTTFLFNLNPLLRYDGYYILSDLIGSPNLAHRSRDLLRFFTERYAFGLKTSRPPRVRDRTEAIVMTIFGSLAMPYRMFIGISIVLVIMERYASIGLVLGTVMGVMWLGWPAVKGVSYLASSPRLLGRRVRAIGVSALVIGVPLAVIGMLPAPSAEYAPAIVEAEFSAPLRATESGFVTSINARAGDLVNAGDVVMVLTSRLLEAEAIRLETKLRKGRLDVDASMGGSAIDHELALAQYREIQFEHSRVHERIEALTIRAPIAGRVAPASGTAVDFDGIIGRYLERGRLVGFISSPDLVVRALVPDRSAAHILGESSDGAAASIRVRGSASETTPGRVVSSAVMGSRDLDNPAYAQMTSGSIAIDPAQSDRLMALESHWLIEIKPEEHDGNPISRAQPGVRAKVRFALQPEPLLEQWWRRSRQYLNSRLGG